jgi:hypothetical protein
MSVQARPSLARALPEAWRQNEYEIHTSPPAQSPNMEKAYE